MNVLMLRLKVSSNIWKTIDIVSEVEENVDDSVDWR